MFTEFQLKADHLIDLVIQRLRLFSFCQTNVFTMPDKTQCILDHIWIPSSGGTLLRHMEETTSVYVNFGQESKQIPVNQLQMAVPVNLYIKEKLKADDPAVDPSSYKYVFEIKAIINLLMSGTNLCASYDHVDLGVFLGAVMKDQPALQSLLVSTLKNAINSNGPVCAPIDLTKVTNILQGAKLTNAGLSANQEFDRVAFRFEFNGPSDVDFGVVADWLEFHLGFINSQPLDQDWSFFLAKDLLVNAFIDRFSSGILDAEAKWIQEILKDPTKAKEPKLLLEGEPVASWFQNDFGGTILLKADVTVVDACPLTKQDVGVALTVLSNLTLDNGDLKTVTLVAWDATDSDVLLCALELGPLAVHNLPLSSILEDIFITKNDIPPLGKGCTTLSAHEMDCRFPIEIPSLKLGTPYTFGAFTPNSMVGIDAGPVLQGTLTGIKLNEPFWSISFSDWSGWGVGGNCGSLEYSCTGSFELNASNEPQTPAVKLCKIGVVELRPPEVEQDITKLPNVFDPNKEGIFWLPSKLTLTVAPDDMVAMDAHPWYKSYYPIWFVFETSAGWRSVLIPPVPALPADWEQASGQEKILAIADCDKPETGLFGIPGKFDFHWLGDPPENMKVSYLWEVAATGLSPNESLRLEGKGTEETIGFASSRSGIAQLTILMSTAVGSPQLTIFHGANAISQGEQASAKAIDGKPATTTGRRQLFIKQTLLAEKAALDLDSPATHIAVGTLASVPVLLSTSSTGLEVYDLSIPAVPTLILQFHAADLRGAMMVGGKILAWGKGGMTMLATGKHRHKTSLRGQGEGVKDLVRSNQYLYALTAKGLDTYNTDLRHLSSFAIEGALGLAVNGNSLVVSREHGLMLFNLAHPLNPKQVAIHATKDVAGLTRPKIVNGNRAIFARSASGGGTVLEINDDQRVQEIIHFKNDPWFVRSARINGMLVRLDSGGTAFRVYTNHKTVTLRYGGTNLH